MSSMDDLIPVINRLQDVFALVGGSQPIDLPQIVVIGSQSSGKSSVLENIVGRDFLPRGSGIVTRRPLVLQLVHQKTIPEPEDGSSDSPAWGFGEFLHMQGQRFYDFGKVRDEIAKETDRVTGKNKGISDKAIRLRICSPHVVDLTLVDLPGITKVPVGDQPKDIETQIRKMLLTYVTNPNCIMLAVSAANTDLANSDALKLAKEVDPTGVRTIGVVTKLDLMDKGTDALDVLMGRVIPLRLGFVGVVNRSQMDINTNKDIRKSLEAESSFFETHSVYRTVASKMGTPFLTRKLNHLLLAHIRECLPDIRARVTQSLAALQTEMAEYGDPALASHQNKGAVLLQILTRYSSAFCDAIDGKSKELTTTELHGGARINYIFNDVFPDRLGAINPVDSLSVQDIRIAIRNATGTRQTLFVPEVSFELLAKQQISRLEEPALGCCHNVYDEMIRIVSQCQPREMLRFVNLRDRVIDVACQLLTKALEPTRDMVSNLIKIELAYINTSHPDFIGGTRAVTQLMHRRQEKGDRKEERPERSRLPPTPAPAPTPAAVPVSTGNDGLFSSLFGTGNAAAKKGTAGQTSAPVPVHGASGGGGKASEGYGAPEPSRLESALPPNLREQTSQLSEHEKIVTEIIISFLKSYFGIVVKNIQDSIPKAIMHFLVNHVKENLQHQLVSSLYKEEMLDELLEEADQISQRRQQIVETMTLLRNALEILTQVKEASYR